MINYNDLREGQEFYGNGYKQGYKQAILDGKTNFSRPQGEWIEKGKYQVECNQCHYDDCAIKTNFCPNCGADMREKVKNNG